MNVGRYIGFSQSTIGEIVFVRVVVCSMLMEGCSCLGECVRLKYLFGVCNFE